MGASLQPARADHLFFSSLPGEKLIPAAIGVRTDRKGNSWNVESNGTLGRIGSTMVNSGLALSVNQQKFETFQPRMTTKGKEFVIHGRPLEGLSGIEIVRRIRFLEEVGALRFVELFFNGSSTPVSLDIVLATSFSGNYQSSVTDQGNIEPVMLGERETGILVTPGSSQSNRAFLFTLCGPESPNKPTISAQSRYGLRFQYNIELQPGETKGIAHIVSQTIVPRDFDRKSLARVFRPFSLEEFSRTIPPQFRGVINNRSALHTRHERLKTLKSLGIEPGDLDILATGDQTRLLGKATPSTVEIETDFGKAKIPFEKIAAIVGENGGVRDRSQIFLRDGQIITGQIPNDREIAFAPQSGGKMKLKAKSLDRLVFATRDPVDFSRSAMIKTVSGDQLRLRNAENAVFPGLTPWGKVNFAFSDLVVLEPAPEGHPGYLLRLRNGTECLVFLTGENFVLSSEFIEKLNIPVTAVQAIIPEKTPKEMLDLRSARLHLQGDQIVSGSLTGDLQIFSNGQSIALPTNKIRLLQPEGNGNQGAVQVEMWDGSRVGGLLREPVLGLTVGEKKWIVPLGDIQRIVFPGPVLSEDERKKVAVLVLQLGNDVWSLRENATRELSRFGPGIIPMLQQGLVQNPDPEVRRRIDRILSSLKQL